MMKQVVSNTNCKHFNTSGPIIHLPDSDQGGKRSDVVMVTSPRKLKASGSTNSNQTGDAIIIHSGNFNLYRPGRSQEVVNGLQQIYLEKDREQKQRKDSAKLFLDFIDKRRKITNKQVKTKNNADKIDEQVAKGVGQEQKGPERFGVVRNSIELTNRSLRNSARQGWVPEINPIVTLHLIHPEGDGSQQPAIHLPESGACKGQTVTNMTTALPRITSSRITPCSTPLPPGLVPVRSHSATSMYTYGAYPPPELSSSGDFVNIPKRINPLAPPPPRKRINWSWETVDQHHENEKRRLLMQKREHTRYHSAWSKAFYGSPAEMEAYRRHFREVLKQQMSDRDQNKRTQMQEKIKETERAIAYDRECRMNDSHEYFRKHNYLMKFRDGNKSLMENAWDARKYNKKVEDRIDRERLRYNPINWSCSLK